MMNKVKIEIYNQSYTINTQEDSGYVFSLAEELNEQIGMMMENSPGLSLNEALVLCAIGYLDIYKKERSNADHIRVQLKDYLEDAAKARMEVDEARRNMEKITRELENFKRNSR